MPPSPSHALRSRHAPWWALVAMCLVVLGPLVGQVIGRVSGQSGGQIHGHHAAHHASGEVGLLSSGHTDRHANSDTGSHANSHTSSHVTRHPGHATDQGIGLADACGYCSLYQHVPVLSLLVILAALAGPIHRQGGRHRPARGHSRPAVFPQALTRAPPFSP